ncbi:unnamed protein product [Caenorhabditis bovis]|uniref:Ground-like domain-containing protein n=1 Tax=Caenorhabditis bovis TaxID=2654633 RepID=A0A8S1EXS1_9PELO|nr:unnamed protein product [Caenorhabditis bovis]
MFCNQEVYSAAPINTPLSRVYVFGKLVYIRQPFMIPQRNISFAARSSKFGPGPLDDDFDRILSRKDLFEGRRERKSYIEGAYFKPSYSKMPESYAQHPEPKLRYPLKQCYTEETGYMCCNKNLENVMKDTVEEMIRNKWKSCNIQQMANLLQQKCQDAFGTDFETIAGVGDFASKIHFYSDYVCKMERQGRVLLAYATPNRHNNPNAPYHVTL